MAAETLVTFSNQTIGGPENPQFWNCRPAVSSIRLNGVRWQACTYWSSSQRLVICVRQWPGGEWSQYHYNGTGGLANIVLNGTLYGAPEQYDESHYPACVDFDKNGYLHVFAHNRNSPMNYRMSTAPVWSWNGALTSALVMVNSSEESDFVDYPQFFRDPLDNLFCMWRYGNSPQASQYFYKYDHAADEWLPAVGAAGLLTNGYVQSPNHGVYFNSSYPRFTSDWDGEGAGYCYFQLVWKVGGSSDSNIEDLQVIRWDGLDGWTRVDGTTQTIPINRGNDAPVLSDNGTWYISTARDMEINDDGSVIAIIYRREEVSTGAESFWLYIYENGEWRNVSCPIVGLIRYDRLQSKWRVFGRTFNDGEDTSYAKKVRDAITGTWTWSDSVLDANYPGCGQVIDDRYLLRDTGILEYLDYNNRPYAAGSNVNVQVRRVLGFTWVPVPQVQSGQMLVTPSFRYNGEAVTSSRFVQRIA